MRWGSNTKIEQKLVMDDSGLVWGRKEVEEWREENRDAESVLWMWKLALCPEYRNARINEHNYRALGATTQDLAVVEELLEQHFKMIRHQLIEYLRHGAHGKNAPIPDDIQIEALVTVPAILKGQSRGIMINAATEAGFRNVRLGLESVCAAAAYMAELRKLGLFKV